MLNNDVRIFLHDERIYLPRACHERYREEHSIENPKLRGIAIGPLLSRLYDHILNIRFCDWYTPNKEQAGYRKWQGCVLQLFSLFLLIENSKRSKKDVYLGLLDFEKAFDYTNRYLLMKDVMKNGIGKNMLKQW